MMGDKAVPDMPDLERDQGCSRGDHQELGPALLQVDADSLGQKHCAIKQGEETGSSQGAAPGHDFLKFVQQKNNRPGVMEQQLVFCPIGNLIEPGRPSI